MRKKLASHLLVIGGGSLFKDFTTELENRVSAKIKNYDPFIEKVKVLDLSQKEIDGIDLA